MKVTVQLIKEMLPRAKEVVEKSTNKQVGEILVIKIGQALNRLGTIKKLPVNGYQLRISAFAFETYYKDKESIERELFKTLIHEYIHTLPGCMNHGRNFVKACIDIDIVTGYRIGTKHIDDRSSERVSAAERVATTAKYKVVCNKCGTTTHRNRKTGWMSRLTECTCTRCCTKGNFSLYTL